MSSDGHVDIQKTGEKTKTGADKETFGTGRAAQVEAGKKGGAISAQASPEERHERAMKAGEKQRGQPKGSSSD